MVESHAKNVTNRLNNPASVNSSHSESQGYLQDCLRLQVVLSRCTFAWVPRSANKAAHSLCGWRLHVNWEGWSLFELFLLLFLFC